MRGLIWLLMTLLSVASARQHPLNEPISMFFVNPFDSERELSWISPTGELSHMGVIAPSGGEQQVTTYAGHEFGWRPVGGPEQCATDLLEGTVRIVHGVSQHVFGEQLTVDADQEEEEDPLDQAPFTAQFVNDSPRRMVITHRDATGEVVAANATVPSKERRGVAVSVRVGEFVDWQDEADGELLYRSVVENAQQRRHVFRNDRHTHLCSEATPHTAAVRNATYYDAHDGRAVRVEVLSEDPFVAYMPEWSAGAECATMEAEATRIGLSHAQVFGKKAVIADRRAISANLYWNERDAKSVNNRLIERAFEFTRQQRGYPIVAGAFQEPLNFIEYSVAGEYRPHCDGVCHRTKYARGGRVATLIHYCQAADLGGATVFPKTGIKVAPVTDSALLFAYKRDDGFMDDGNTLHTGCLVREGRKQIVTMWMREDANEREPWSNFMS